MTAVGSTFPASLRGRVLDHLRGRLAAAPLPLRLVFWDGESFDFAPDSKIEVTLRSPRILRMLMMGRMGHLARAYVEGELTVDGKIEDVVGIGIDLAERIGRSTLVARLAPLRPYLPFRHTRRRDQANTQYHYDVSNAFYALWLDAQMVYSCAYFRDEADTLDAAQERKLDHICRKLRLQPGERLLDIGCGWGGLLRWAATHDGVTGVGVTLSRHQCDYARERVAAEGLRDRIEIRLQDYRDLPGEDVFDKIVSVGMYEHVGIANLPTYFATIARLLRAGGAALNHGIVTGDPSGRAQGPPGGDVVARYVFPGGAVPPLSRAGAGLAPPGGAGGDVEDLRPHYARTLVHWVRRLEAREADALEAAGPERYRVWRMYMAAMAFAFDRGWLSVAQILAYKPTTRAMAPRPFTREYQYGGAAEPTLAGPLKWSAITPPPVGSQKMSFP